MAGLIMHQAVETESSGQVLRAKIVTMETNSVVLKFLDPATLKQGQVLNMRPAGQPDRTPVPVRIEWTLETAVDYLAKVFLPAEAKRNDRRLFPRVQVTADFTFWRGTGENTSEHEGRALNISSGGMEGMVHRSIDLFPMEVVRFRMALHRQTLGGDARVLRVFAAADMNRIAFSFEQMEDSERVLLVQTITHLAQAQR
jgi:hypothetical protein